MRILPGFLMCGHLGPHSHAWLEFGEFQIDITADQFVRDHERSYGVDVPETFGKV